MPDDEPATSKVAVADRQMSDAEALMWRVEKDPFLASTFGTVTILDRAPDFDRLRARMEAAVHGVPRLGWRVQPHPTALGAPIWADDPDFDIDLHVRRVALPAPGTRRQLLDLATLFVLDPLDRTRPLWQFLVVEGLEGGKAALVTKMHHTITDGINGVRMSMQYVDLTRDGASPAVRRAATRDPEPVPPPSTVDTMLGFVHATFRLPISIARQVGELLADPVVDPDRRLGRRRRDPWRPHPAVRDGRGALAAVDSPFDAAPVRDGADPVPSRPTPHRSGWAARSTRRSSPPAPRRPTTTTSPRGHRSTSYAPRWP